jgi:hypothetical protein
MTLGRDGWVTSGLLLNLSEPWFPPGLDERSQTAWQKLLPQFAATVASGQTNEFQLQVSPDVDDHRLIKPQFPHLQHRVIWSPPHRWL